MDTNVENRCVSNTLSNKSFGMLGMYLTIRGLGGFGNSNSNPQVTPIGVTDIFRLDDRNFFSELSKPESRDIIIVDDYVSSERDNNIDEGESEWIIVE